MAGPKVSIPTTGKSASLNSMKHLIANSRSGMEYRLRRHDEEYRWILNIGVPRVNPDGSLAGYIGSCVDVTERKSAEEALRTVSGRLICPSLNLI
jgi:PAS domain S-box-containing protein